MSIECKVFLCFFGRSQVTNGVLFSPTFFSVWKLYTYIMNPSQSNDFDDFDDVRSILDKLKYEVEGREEANEQLNEVDTPNTKRMNPQRSKIVLTKCNNCGHTM